MADADEYRHGMELVMETNAVQKAQVRAGVRAQHAVRARHLLGGLLLATRAVLLASYLYTLLCTIH